MTRETSYRTRRLISRYSSYFPSWSMLVHGVPQAETHHRRPSHPMVPGADEADEEKFTNMCSGRVTGGVNGGKNCGIEYDRLRALREGPPPAPQTEDRERAGRSRR